MRRLWDFECTGEECGHTWEALVEYEDRDGQSCPRCETSARRLMSAVAHWIPSQERTNAQLKKRSLDHHKEILKGGHDPRARNNGLGFGGDLDYRAKTRSKNRKKGVVQDKLSTWRKYHKDEPQSPIEQQLAQVMPTVLPGKEG